MKNRIVIDSLGGDGGAIVAIEGLIKLLDTHPQLTFTIVGDETLIREKLEKANADISRVKIVHTTTVLTNDDNLREAFFAKSDASIFKALKELSADEDTIGLLTAGNSGAILMGNIRYNLDSKYARPCFAALLPAEKGGFTCLVDCGATIDVNAHQLQAFAHIGTDFMRRLYKIDSPKVALLSNGVEDGKGNHVVKEAFPILKEDTYINFVGNVEGTNALTGDCDVVVCDGFAGNQVLKVTEATAKRLIKDVIVYSKKTNKPELMEVAKHLMQKYDMTNQGGAFVLGTKKTVIKLHGNAGSEAFHNVVDILVSLEEGKALFDEKIFGKQER